MRLPKKVKGRSIRPAWPSGARCSAASAWRGDFLEHAPPRGAAADDFLDAAALLFIAARHARGEARPFPDPPGVDGHGIPDRDLGC